MTSQNYINHINLVLDASGSMDHLRDLVPQVADNFIKHEAERSQQLDQETRVTVYTFNRNVQCLFYDKDVLRLPSLRGIYHPGGGTALIDATLKSLADLSKTATLYGDHAFLTYVLTDGEENSSRSKPRDLQTNLSGLPNNWTTAVFVPNQLGVRDAKAFGFPAENIAVWDTSEHGFREVGEVIRTTTDNYMDARQRGGFVGTRSLFTLSQSDIKAAVQTGALQALTPGQFRLLDVHPTLASDISHFVETMTGRPYKLGEAYYQLSKREEIQPQKDVAIFDRKAYTVFHGPAARQMLGLPDGQYVKINPVDHPDYTIFVQSTSVNRKLVPGTKVLLLS